MRFSLAARDDAEIYDLALKVLHLITPVLGEHGCLDARAKVLHGLLGCLGKLLDKKERKRRTSAKIETLVHDKSKLKGISWTFGKIILK